MPSSFPPRLICAALLALSTTFVQAAKPVFKPNLGPDLPAIKVTCGDVTLMLRQISQWTPGRIDYRGTAMTTERSAYSTVFSFPEVGFIGTGHLENEPEVLKSLTFILDGQTVAAPPAELKGTTFRFERQSRIRNFDLTNIIEIRDNRLYETATIHTETAQPLNLVYHFMHAWTPTVSAFLAGHDDAPDRLITDTLRNDADVMRKFYINSRVDWMSVYEPQSRQYAVSRLVQAPDQGSHISMIWNVSGTYRKYYLKCFEKATVPAGFTGTWQMVTGFGQAEELTWKTAVQALAEGLKP